ncbi:MAG: hypothetical protein IJ165_07650 [Proteobacteria bacterium]|nr:hypothetical protein [Pseudomonadota bacterium]
MLIPNAHYEDLDASAAGIAPQKTIVVQSKGSKKMLIFGILWTTFWTLAFGWFFYKLITDPGFFSITGGFSHTIWGTRQYVPSRPATINDSFLMILVAVGFIGGGVGLIYFGMKAAFSKAWIAVTDDAIYCMRGLSYNPKKYKKFPCKSPTAKVYQLPTSKVGDTQYCKIVLGGPNGSITFASGLAEADANGYRQMLQNLLDGKEECQLKDDFQVEAERQLEELLS